MIRTVASHLLQLRANTHIGDVFDIIVMSFLVYVLLVWFRRRASRALIITLSAVASLYALTRVLNMYLTSTLFHAGAAATLVMMVIIFQSDIRRAFEHMDGRYLLGSSRRRRFIDPTLVDVVVEAVADLARNRVGALIVFQGYEALERHLRGGTAVDAHISHPLLVSIFDHHSPGHDGAVLIARGRIARLGVVLPLSGNMREVAGHGTRHAAALGIAEQSDALAVVVSEERGTVAVAHQRSLHPVDTMASLRERIEAFHRPHAAPHRQWLSPTWLRAHVGLKAASVAIAGILWLLVAYRVETVYRTVEIPVDYRNVPSGLIIAEGLPTHVALTLSGPERDFDLRTSTPSVSVDMASIKEGDNEIAFTAEHIAVPQGLDLIQVEPNRLEFNASRAADVNLPVKVVTHGAPPNGLILSTVTVHPESVRVRVDASVWGKITSIPTEPLDLDSLTRSAPRRLRLSLPRGTTLCDSTRTTVRVQPVITASPPHPTLTQRPTAQTRSP